MATERLARQITIKRVLSVVSQIWGVPVHVLKAPYNRAVSVPGRHAYCLLCREVGRMKLQPIATGFNRTDAHSAHEGCDSATALIASNADFRAKYAAAKAELQG